MSAVGSTQRVYEIQTACLADDLEVTDAMCSWTEKQLVTYFESGGAVAPGTASSAVSGGALVPGAGSWAATGGAVAPGAASSTVAASQSRGGKPMRVLCLHGGGTNRHVMEVTARPQSCPGSSAGS